MSHSSLRGRVLELYKRSEDAERGGDFELALEPLREAIRLVPDFAPLHNRLGVLLAFRLKRLPEAVESLSRAVELEPTNLNYVNNLRRVVDAASPFGWH